MGTPLDGDELTIAQLAALTGVAEATLRIWETRHGVPQPRRLANGHRRYSRREAELILAAVAQRTAGLSVGAALEQARSATAEPIQSVYAALRERRSDLVPLAMRKPVLIRVSRAIEDECVARATPGLLIGAFQRDAFYRASEPRWRELAGAMRVTIVLADFERRRARSQGPNEIPIPAQSPLRREWVLIGPAGCLLARERSGPGRRGAERVFDALWSPEPEVVHAASTIVISILRHDPLAEPARAALGPPPAPSSPELRRAAALTNRIVGYIGEAPI